MGNYKKSQLRKQLLTSLNNSNPYSMQENVAVSKSDKKQSQVRNQDAAFIPATVQKHAQERVIELVEKVVKEPNNVSVPLSVPVHLQEDIQTLALELLELIVPGSAQEQNDSEKTQSNSNSTKTKKNTNYTNYANNFSTSNQVKERQTENLYFQPKSNFSKATSSQNGPLSDAIKLHEEGIKGNKQSVKNAISAFKDLAKQKKNNLEIKAYLGSATTLLGRDASSVTDKMKYALEGLKILDEVVQEAPNLVIARVLRGNVSYRLPEMYFQRTSTAIEDFSFLVSAYEKDSSILTEAEYVDILKNVIDACNRTNQSGKASMFQSKLKNTNNAGSNVPVNANNSNEASSKISKKKGKANGLTDEAILIHRKATSSQNGPLSDAIKLHEEGIKGNKQSVRNAISAFKDLAKQQKNNLEIKAYLGSATTLLGRDASSVTDKMKYALEGLKILDEVVQEAPNLVIARVLRGNVSYRLPEMYFQRTSTAIEDFSFLVSAYEKDSSILTEAEYVDILKNVIDACKRTNQSEKASMFQTKLKDTNSVGSDVQINENNSNKASSKTTIKKGKASGLTDEAILMHQKALNGGPAEVQRAIDFFESFIQTNTAPEVEMAYLDVQSMLGRDSNNTFEMFGSAFKSMKTMDRIINENPANPKLRLVRAKHCLRLPENFFRRSAIAVSDIEFLLTEYEKNQELLDEEMYQQLLFDLGCAYERLEMIEEAKEAWSKLSQTSPSNEIQQIVNEKQEQYSYKQEKLGALSQVTKDKFYAKAKELHALGAKGNKLAAKQSLEAWGKAQQAYPDCEVANTYFAASKALMGKYASDPQEMFGETMKALKLLKTSIKTDNPELKFLRGSIYSVLPEGFFHTSNNAIKDFAAVKSAYELNRQNPPISEDQYVKLLFDLGHLYKRTQLLDKAEKTFKKLVKVAPSSKYAQLIERQEGNLET